MNGPWDLRVEHLDEALGIDVLRPRLSWKLPVDTERQHAYRVRTSDWDSGRVESNENVLVRYGGPPPSARQRVTWQVQVWTERGPSVWSDPSWWEMGLLAPHDWQARWIEPVELDGPGEPGRRPAHLLRTRWSEGGARGSARLYATAHGLYEAYLNGERVGDLELTPGFTSYAKRLQVQTYDVTALLAEEGGVNELRVVLSDGWYRGQIGSTREHDVWGSSVALLAQLEIDGVVVVTTDASWEHGRSEIVAADLIEGQRTDLRITDDARAWAPVRVVDHDLRSLCSSPAPPVRQVEVLRPRSITRLADGHDVVDLGQNVNGWLRLSNLGPRDSALTITHGEALDADGDVTTDHLRPIDWQTQQFLGAGQVDEVISDGTTARFQPRHTTHGFQYARVVGHPQALTVEDVAGIVVHTDLRRTGWFRCSDARLERLHDAADWSFRTNACDIPTDCPQRERVGWTGDWQIFAPTAAFLYDVAGFTTKWLRDLAADQRDDGAVRNFAPNPAPPGADKHPIKTYLEASAGWGDAAVAVPWTMWRSYGDRRLLEEQWPSMVGWVEFQANIARTARHQHRVDRDPSPAPHEQYLWDTGFHWGEWCEPDLEAVNHFEHLDRDLGMIATAYFARSAATLAKTAAVLDRTSDSDHYEALARNVTNAWRAEYVDPDGNVCSDRQADHVRALAFDLVPDELRPQTANRLVELVHEAGGHLNTGFLATPFLLPVLADTGHLDLAYELLLRDTSPSWLAMINRGATTIWEEWDGIDADGRAKASLNHYSKGAVISFLHEYVAGIRLVDDGPGYRHFRIAPTPGGGITWAEARHDSPYGRIESSWTTLDGAFRLVVRVPPNTTADVQLPDGRRARIGPGTAVFTTALNACDQARRPK